jgi:hypothetical protein
MTSIAGLNNFNNLLYNTRKIAIGDHLEHKAGRVPLDLSYKTPARTNEILNCNAAQINSKSGDLKYKPRVLHSRPNDTDYNARIDPTILNAVRYKYTDVSGLLIPPINLPKNKYDMNKTTRPLIPYGIVQ